MANTILTPDMITREALAVLHEKLSFVGTINREYDDSFARTGAKIGDTLRIRKPARYTVRTGATLSVQDHEEESVTLPVQTQVGVDVNFTSAELTMDLDDFSQRVLEPQMAVLASHIEADVLQGTTQDVYNLVGTPGTTPASTTPFADARAKLNQNLAPKDNQRYVQLDSLAMGAVVAGLQGLFHDSTQVAQGYRDGMIARHSGFDWYENEKVYVHTNPDDITGIAVDEPGGTNLVEGTSTLDMDGLGTTFPAGTVFTIDGVFAVHPETKDTYAHLQQFVVTSDTTVATNEGTVSFSPAIYSTGAKQNVTALPSDNDAVVVVGSASTAYEQHLAYHKDFATFATADLIMPEGVHFASRQTFDGISMRVVRQYDINADKIPCRIDVLYGYVTMRPELACRITG